MPYYFSSVLTIIRTNSFFFCIPFLKLCIHSQIQPHKDLRVWILRINVNLLISIGYCGLQISMLADNSFILKLLTTQCFISRFIERKNNEPMNKFRKCSLSNYWEKHGLIFLAFYMHFKWYNDAEMND